MSTEAQQPSEEELRAAYEEEIKRVRVEHVILDGIVTLVNLGMRRSGLIEGSEGERDPAQVQLAIEAVRAQLPLIERVAPEQAKPIRDALSQLQLAYVRIGGQPAGARASGGPEAAGAPPSGAVTPADEPAPSEPPPPAPGEPGPAQRSGRLWIPGQ